MNDYNRSGPMNVYNRSGPMNVYNRSGPMNVYNRSGPMNVYNRSGPMNVYNRSIVHPSCCIKGFGIDSIPSAGHINTTEVPLHTTRPRFRVSSVSLNGSSGSETSI